MHITGTVPPAWVVVPSDDVRVEAVVDLGFEKASPGFQAEGLAYDLRGNPLKTIAPRNSHLPLELLRTACDRLSSGVGSWVDSAVDFYVEAASNPDVAAGAFAPTPLGDRATCLLYTSPSPRDGLLSRMPSSA